MENQSTDSAPAALADLVAARLVSHEMIGDPGRLGGEAAALSALCRHVAGPVWRIEPYHYAFRISPGDGAPDPAAQAEALEAALAAELGADAVWVSATDLIAAELADAPAEAARLDTGLLLLRAGAEAVADGLAAVPAAAQAVIHAGFAVRAARLAADPDLGPLAERLAALEAGQAAIRETLAASAAARAANAEAEARLVDLLGTVLRRLDAQADVLHGHIAREDRVAERLGELAALAGSPAAFHETLGLTLAEFLARIERREATVPARVPQAN